MAQKATIEYQAVNGDTKQVYNETIEGEVTVTEYGPASDLIKVKGEAKAVYVHRANLIAIIIDKTE